MKKIWYTLNRSYPKRQTLGAKVSGLRARKAEGSLVYRIAPIADCSDKQEDRRAAEVTLAQSFYAYYAGLSDNNPVFCYYNKLGREVKI